MIGMSGSIGETRNGRGTFGRVPFDWFAGAVPDEPVVLCTQTANDRALRVAAKLGFSEVERFGVWSGVVAGDGVHPYGRLLEG